MFHDLKDVPLLLCTQAGRLRLLTAIRRRLWPMWPLARLYRRTLVRNTRVIAVVGSFGKSTTTRAVTVALGREIHPQAWFNAGNSVARAVLRIQPGDRHAIIEVGIGVPGQMVRYARLIRPDITVVTSIGSEHRRSLKTLEVTRFEKAQMVRMLSASGLAVLNGDDPNVLWMQTQTRARAITFGFSGSNDVRATDVRLDWPTGVRFALHAYGETRVVRTRLIGSHMVYPILAAATVALAEGFTLDQIVPALEILPPTPGRMEPIQLPNGAIILRDDYKSPLETMQVALHALSEIPARRRIAVLGEIEEPPKDQRGMYRKLGEQVAQVASHVVFVGGRTAWRGFGSGARQGGLAPGNLVNAGRSALKAIEALRNEFGRGDVVLIKGRENQRLDRITLAFMGRTVRCDLSPCSAKVRCRTCPMLEGGLNGFSPSLESVPIGARAGFGEDARGCLEGSIEDRK